MVWMRVGAKPDVRKLYGIIHNDIPKGEEQQRLSTDAF